MRKLKEPSWREFENLVKDVIIRGEYENKAETITDLPDPSDVREDLKRYSKIHDNRNF